MFKTILWATDFSEHARNAGQQVIPCAQRLETSTVYALTVVDPEDLPFILVDAPDPFVSEKKEEEVSLRLERDYERKVLDHLSEEAQPIRDAGIAVDLLLRIGTPWKEILSVAEEVEATLIVMASHGKRTLRDVLLGSTVENVTRRACCPVLVVR